jgi:hypothetical protein
MYLVSAGVSGTLYGKRYLYLSAGVGGTPPLACTSTAFPVELEVLMQKIYVPFNSVRFLPVPESGTYSLSLSPVGV